jgi:FAD/FMN-containing dehydrogenase
MTPTSVKDRNRDTPAPPYHDLASEITGSMIVPGDRLYDETRAVYNAMIDRRPAALVKCADSSDVAACVRFASRHGIDLAVRGGGHSAGGLGV